MQQQISLHEVNLHLSQYIHAVEEGAEYVITRRGKPVARIMPLADAEVEEQRVLTPKQEAALERTRQRVEQGCFRGMAKVTRDEIYPVARIVPPADAEERRVLTPEQKAALERIKQRLETGYDLGIGKIDREALYLERWERNGRS